MKNKDIENDVQLGQIKTLQLDLKERITDMERQDDVIRRLNNVISQLDKSCTQKEQLIEVLKLDGKNFAKASNKNSELESTVESQITMLDELKQKYDNYVDMHQRKLAQINANHSKEINKLQDELDLTINKSKEEINELLNNFGELENELSFCQDELTSKVNENEELHKEIQESEANYSLKEEQLLKDLESLNEQNENILQTEIQKYKSENEDTIMEMRKIHANEQHEAQLEFETQLTKFENEQEEQKANDMLKIKTDNEEKVLKVLADKEDALQKLKCFEESVEKENKNSQLNIKAKSIEIESKSRIIEKLGRRNRNATKTDRLSDEVTRTRT